MGPGRVDGAQDAWMGPGTRGRGRKVRRCCGGRRGVGGQYGRWRYQGHARVCGAREGEWQDTDKGGYARQGMYAESLRVDALGFCGRGVTADEGRLWQGEGSGRVNAIGKQFALCKVRARITPLKRANSISHANVHEPG